MNVLIICILSLLTLCSTAEETQSTYNDLVNKTMEIFGTCFFSHRRDTFLLAGAYEEFLRVPGPPVALIAQSHRSAFDLHTLTKYSFFMYTHYSFPRLVRKLHYFAVIAISQPMLRLVLQRIRDSSWSNSDGFYLIIDRHTETRGCINAESYLRTAWAFDLQFSVFFCIDRELGPMLYTYNPYSEKSPKVWVEEERFPGRRGHPWILLKRPYLSGTYRVINSTELCSRGSSNLIGIYGNKGEEICKDLNFDKTIFVDGYEVRVNGINVQPLLSIDLTKDGDQKFSGDNGEVVKIVAEKLNASLYVVIYNGTSYDLGGIGVNGTITGLLADVGNGAIDMGMNTRPLFDMWKFRYTYPHAEGGMCVITQPSGYVSEFKKVLGFISVEASFGASVIMGILFMVMAVHQGPIPAALNIVRLLTAVTLENLPTRSSSRIVLTMGLLLCIIINGVFQGHWSALLTVSVSYPNIDTIQDLKRSGFAIYGPKVLENFLGDRDLDRLYHGVSYDQCKQKVLESKTAACLGDCLHLYQRIRNDRLHHSKKLTPLIQVFVAREDWPLFSRVNHLIQRMVQAGLVTMWRRQNARQIFRERRVRRVQHKKGFQVLKLQQLAFSFYILSAGYSSAILIFLIEVAIGWYLEKQKKRRNARTVGLRR